MSSLLRFPTLLLKFILLSLSFSLINQIRQILEIITYIELIDFSNFLNFFSSDFIERFDSSPFFAEVSISLRVRSIASLILEDNRVGVMDVMYNCKKKPIIHKIFVIGCFSKSLILSSNTSASNLESYTSPSLRQRIARIDA